MHRLALLDPASRSELRYLRVCMGGEAGEPGMTLYEVDAAGWVHRQVQLHADGSRFSPEDILMCQPIATEAMTRHPATDEIDRDEFEVLWREVYVDRPFLARVPDPRVPWTGRIQGCQRPFHVAWAPHGPPDAHWSRVPGFVEFYVDGDPTDARAVCSARFVESPIEWHAVRTAA